MLPAARLLADVLNPLLALLLLVLPLATARVRGAGARLRAAVVAWSRCALAVGMPVLLAEAGKKWQVWPGHPWFPSGHEAFAASAAACLVLLYGRAWLTAALPAAGLMGWALVAAGYHAVPDVLAAAVYGPLAAALLLRLTGGPVRPPRAA